MAADRPSPRLLSVSESSSGFTSDDNGDAIMIDPYLGCYCDIL